MSNAENTSNKTSKADEPASNAAIVVNIGKKQKRKNIRKLRKGRGPLMNKVEDIVDGLRSENLIDEGIRPVVLVVREKKRNRDRWW